MTASSLDSFKSEVERLVRSFERDRRSIQQDGMNEADLRIQYLDPFFAALGWDVGNRALAPFASREVLVEPPHRMRGASRRPDYLFRVGGIDKFICEAKRPFDNVERHFFQAQNYVYNLRLWFGVLSDFERFIVFLVGAQPKADRPFPPLEGWRLSFWEYIDSAEKIWENFSRDAVADGALDRLAHNAAKVYRAGRQGWLIKPERTQRIDGKFLSFLEDERASLAKGLRATNDIAWTTQTLTEATQKIIDRLLFQRICEDRHIDVGRPLTKTLTDWEERRRIDGQLWPSVSENFDYLKGTFNGGLYGKIGDQRHLIDEITVPDRWLADFVEELTAEDSPYLFSVMPVEILGSVYERFLGSIVLPTGKVEPKPEVRKAGGVYYTPKYVVDFIVRQTVGALTKGKAPSDVAKIRILDPACGSGSFLIGAFEQFCDYYLSWLLANPGDRERAKCFEVHGDLLLTTGFKRQILKRHIFGVDIDPQAVEVTQMSLYLKVLEGETHESLVKDHTLFPTETYLPDLDSNIKCGNSLISTDAASDFHGTAAELAELKPFNWNLEFGSIIRSGGFDAVIGNPPYLNVDDTWGKRDYRLEYLRTRYSEVYADKTDILFYFLQRGLTLSKNRLGFIVSRAYLEAFKAERLRTWLSKNTSGVTVVDFQNQRIFENVGITTCITLLSKKSAHNAMFYRAQQDEHEEVPLESALGDTSKFEQIAVASKKLGGNPWLYGSASDEAVIAKIDGKHPKLGTVLIIGQGMQTGRNDVFGTLPESVVHEWHIPKKFWRWRARNSDIQPWVILKSDEVLLYLEDAATFSALPEKVQAHLNRHKAELKERAAFTRGDCDWWRYTWPLHKEHFHRDKLFCPYLAQTNRFALDTSGRYLGLTDTTVIFNGDQPEDIRYFLALVNSRILTWRFRFIGKLKSNGIREYFWNSISKLPIPRLDLSQVAQKKLHDSIIEEAQRIIDLTRDYAAASTQEKISIDRTLKPVQESLETKIAGLYDLSETERSLIDKVVVPIEPE